MNTGKEQIAAKENTIEVKPHTTFSDGGGRYRKNVTYDVTEAFAKRNARFLKDGQKLAEIELDEPALPPPGGGGQPSQYTSSQTPVAAETRLAVEAGYPEAGKGKKAAAAPKAEAKSDAK
jgi:hypothetical protein